MSTFIPVRRLEVFRRLATGERVLAGVLAQNAQAVYFQYDPGYLTRYATLSPFSLSFDNSLQPAPSTPHQGLHGVFADSLPDGWGMLLMDRVFRQQGILPHQLTAMDRLAYTGSRGARANWAQAQACVQEVVDALSHWEHEAAGLGVSAQTRAMIRGQLAQTYRLNQGLLAGRNDPL